MKNLFEYFHEIECGNYRLRQLTLTDAQNLLEIYGDTEAMQYNPSKLIKTEEEAKYSIKGLERGFYNKWFIRWGIIDCFTKELIGCITLYHFNPTHQSVYISYALKKKYWGYGIMSQVLENFIAYLAHFTTIHEIIACIYFDNRASVQIARKLNFSLKSISQDYFIFALNIQKKSTTDSS